MQEIKYKAIKYIRLSNADEKVGKESDSVGNQVMSDKVGATYQSLTQTPKYW